MNIFEELARHSVDDVLPHVERYERRGVRRARPAPHRALPAVPKARKKRKRRAAKALPADGVDLGSDGENMDGDRKAPSNTAKPYRVVVRGKDVAGFDDFGLAQRAAAKQHGIVMRDGVALTEPITKKRDDDESPW